MKYYFPSLNRSSVRNRDWWISSFIACTLLAIIFTGCDRQEILLSFSVTETAGITRQHEFIEIEVPSAKDRGSAGGICIRERGQDMLIRGQLLDSVVQGQDALTYTALFPVSVEKNSTKQFDVIYEKGEFHEEQLNVSGSDLNLVVENSNFIADLTDRKATAENGLGSGQISGITLKQFKEQLLERNHINMHWAPNFQKEGLPYRTFGHIRNPDSWFVSTGPYQTTIKKSGSVENYGEIHVAYEYRFLAGVPYFLFSSVISVKEDVELVLLRNDEMTMDSLFTHIQYLSPDDQERCVPLYDGKGIEELENDRVPYNAKWLSFFHETLEYALGTIRLDYDNSNIQGQPSPMYEQHTKISTSARNGRYWNRRLIHDHPTKVPKGSRYTETNAYLIFRASTEDPSGEISSFHRQLTAPLKIKY